MLELALPSDFVVVKIDIEYSEYVVLENRVAAFHGIPIVTLYDGDTYNWDADIVKWLGEYGDFFDFQVVERKRSHLQSTERQLLDNIKDALASGG